MTAAESVRQAALETATDGTQRATAAGLVATPWIEQRDGDVATAILGVADDIHAQDARLPAVPAGQGRSGIGAETAAAMLRDRSPWGAWSLPVSRSSGRGP